MVVISRLLYGAMHVRAFDWLAPPPGSPVDPFPTPASRGIPAPAFLVQNAVLKAPSEPIALYPREGGNLHAFTALTSCAVLDVLTPPYGHGPNPPQCTYYTEVGVAPPAARAPEAPLAGGLAGNSSLGQVEPAPPAGGGERMLLLEPFDPPSDFVIARGVYAGPRLRPWQQGGGGLPQGPQLRSAWGGGMGTDATAGLPDRGPSMAVNINTN